MTALPVPTRAARVDPLVGAVPAGAGRRLGAHAADAVAPLLLATAAALSAGGGHQAAAWGLGVSALVAALVPCATVAVTGRSLGRLLTGTRTVDRATGAAPSRRLLSALVRGRLGTYDLRTGRDPFAPALPPFAFPPVDARRSPAPVAVTTRIAPTVELDSGERFTLVRPLVLGRDPGAAAGAEPYRWADLSRTLSKAHARVEWDGAAVWVTDLGSTNGTALRTRGGTQSVVPHQRTQVPTGVTLLLGERLVRVRETA